VAKELEVNQPLRRRRLSSPPQLLSRPQLRKLRSAAILVHQWWARWLLKRSKKKMKRKKISQLVMSI
jgi:hypothetical protein